MNRKNELDQAQLTYEFRQMFKNIGYEASVQVLYELTVSVNVLASILLEESKNDNTGDSGLRNDIS